MNDGKNVKVSGYSDFELYMKLFRVFFLII